MIIMQRQKQKKKESGFTFIELMVSMVIASFVFAGIYGVYTIQQRSYTVQEQVSEMQQKGRAALDFMVRDIRMAGYNDPDGNCTSRGTSDFSKWKAESTTFTFLTCMDDDGNENTPLAKVTIQYGLYKAYSSKVADDLARKEDSDPNQLIVEGLDALEFCYYLEDPADPKKVLDCQTLVAAADVSRIRSVQISMLVRSTFP
ncbi:MAG: prepilin-type N-terminal cleavage/methylation domain-containing protein, partial [Candidatus Electrothrix sp. AUS4]|nr:prepilin-type N-terminal cleavage/methylation domain-containing protein [Candidatus Electrothrix sp. AUS4]